MFFVHEFGQSIVFYESNWSLWRLLGTWWGQNSLPARNFASSLGFLEPLEGFQMHAFSMAFYKPPIFTQNRPRSSQSPTQDLPKTAPKQHLILQCSKSEKMQPSCTKPSFLLFPGLENRPKIDAQTRSKLVFSWMPSWKPRDPIFDVKTFPRWTPIFCFFPSQSAAR